jgi:hypothetical protein
MFWIKKCPRCRGDLIGESDIHGSFITCLQCGHMLSAAEEAALRGSPAPESRHRPGTSRFGAA